MNQKKKNTIKDNLRTIISAVLIALFIRTFLYQPFTIPSGSMLPNLLIGDYLFVSKYSYGYSKYSIPFSPNIISNRVFQRLPERGDVVVFRLPKDTSIDYIKRIIGLPGDTVQVLNGVVSVNDIPLNQSYYDEHYKYFNQYAKNKVLNEKIGDKSYVVLNLDEESIGDNTYTYKVPLKHYFMMGDNRDNSLDSRFIEQVGYVPYENLIGRAEYLFFSSDRSIPIWKIWQWHKKYRFDRVFKKII
ncbi:MAG: signal peptidase I [Hyphomicrobiales bacterium]|jgi:signal peptidase I|nr:signal peptidase I [Hyphomicrobiales bacterium]